MADEALLVARMRIGRVGRVSMGSFGIFQHGAKASALYMLGCFQPTEITKGGVEVDEFRESRSFALSIADTRMPNDQRNSGIALKVGMFAPASMVAEFPAMVCPEHDNRVVRLSGFLQCLQQFPDISIRVADTGMIPVYQPVIQFGGNWLGGSFKGTSE